MEHKLEIQGKYNKAIIYTDIVDESTLSQIYSMLNCKAFEGESIRIMPDCHAGKGSVIGFTMPMTDYIIPNIIGVDIGCGVLSIKFDKDIDVIEADKIIKSSVPMGFSIHETTSNPIGRLNTTKLKSISDRIEGDYTRYYCSMGTLGGGNHFIEVGEGDDGFKWLTIHTGSRKLGLDIANYHQRRARSLCESTNRQTPNGLEYLTVVKEGSEYLDDMRFAQEYASLNRKLIARSIVKSLGIDPLESVESVHNYIDEDNMIRKGAIRAYKNEKVIIPFNMEDGLIIAEGKSNRDWNCSAPHGAGRILSRGQAKRMLNLEEYEKSMKEKGVYTTSLSPSTLDECAGAYKNMIEIRDSIDPTVDIVTTVKPILNIKA